MTQRVFVQTFGCQMNERDTENMLGLLRRHDYLQTLAAEEADLILLNTCAIREHAGHKAESMLGRYGKLKETGAKKPIIGVAGCLAQQEGVKFLRRFPYVDLVFGPDALPRLPAMLEDYRRHAKRQLDLEFDLDRPVFLHEEAQPDEAGMRPSAYVNISKGCDFRCTFCVVPNTRGPERSAAADEILAEIHGRVKSGVRQIVLLGQNVNSYGKHFSPPFRFPDLLRRIEREIPLDSSLQRIRFTTSHPVDLDTDLMRSFAELPRLCKHLHLPVQSGSDRILKRMKRLYTIEDYRRRIRELREAAPEIAISTDIIVGFPGETEEDFQRTLDLVEEVGYTSLYAFQYSPRPQTPALRLPDDVPEAAKGERLARLLRFHSCLSLAQNRTLEGRLMPVLVEGRNPHEARPGFTGRTDCYRLVHFAAPSSPSLRGALVNVRIEQALSHSLLGSLE